MKVHITQLKKYINFIITNPNTNLMNHSEPLRAEKTKTPLISVIIPYKTDRGYLQECINSLMAQTFKDFEVIISKSDSNCSVNVNNGVARSRGYFIKIVAEDDWLPKDALENHVKNIGNYDIHVGGAITHYPDRKEKYISHLVSIEDIIKRNTIHGGGIMWKRNLFLNKGYDELLDTGEEYDFMIRNLIQGKTIKFFNDIVYNYRVHAQQKSTGVKTKEQHEKRRKQIEEIRAFHLNALQRRTIR